MKTFCSLLALSLLVSATASARLISHRDFGEAAVTCEPVTVTYTLPDGEKETSIASIGILIEELDQGGAQSGLLLLTLKSPDGTPYFPETSGITGTLVVKQDGINFKFSSLGKSVNLTMDSQGSKTAVKYSIFDRKSKQWFQVYSGDVKCSMIQYESVGSHN